MLGVGISLGASVLANWAARAGPNNKMDACVGISCHFTIKIAFDFLKNHLFGLYDYILCMGIV
jgi:predicted alpha/beta-fold hydrolase